MSFDRWPWGVLGLKKPVYNKREVKRAYAKKLKQIDQRTEIQAFTDLREAYDFALGLCSEAGDAGKEHHKSAPEKVLETVSNAVPTQGETSLTDPSADLETPKVIELVIRKSEETIDADLELEQQEAIQAADDWDYLLELSNKIFEQIRDFDDPYNNQAWRDILEDPALFSFSSRRYIEEQVFRALLEQTRYNKDSDAPVTPPGMNSEFVKLLDEHFSWISDGLTFTKNYGEAGVWVFQALSKAVRGPDEESKDSEESSSDLLRVIPWWIYVLIFYLGLKTIWTVKALISIG